jgi:hypothetical protein
MCWMVSYLSNRFNLMTHEEQLEWEQVITDVYAQSSMPCSKTVRTTAIKHIFAFDRRVPIKIGELDAPAPGPIPCMATPTPRAAVHINISTEKRQLQGLSIHLRPDTLEGRGVRRCGILG